MNRSPRRLIAVLALVALAAPAAAAVHSWEPVTDTLASTNANWNPPGPIVDGDTVTFSAAASGDNCTWDIGTAAYFLSDSDYVGTIFFADGIYPVYAIVSGGASIDVTRAQLIFHPGPGIHMDWGDFSILDSTLTSVRPGIDYYGIEIKGYNVYVANAIVKSVNVAGIVFSTSTQYFNRFTGLDLSQVGPGTTALTFGGTHFAYSRLSLDHVSFNDTNIAVNVSAPVLSAAYRIIIYQARGVKAGPLYTAAPNGNVFWGDHLPAEPITDLVAVSGGVAGSVALSWTAPDDYDGVNVLLDQYQVYAASVIVTAAGSVVGAPFLLGLAPIRAAAGTPESITLTGLRPSQGYSFTVKVLDHYGDLSPASDSASALATDTTPPTLTLSTAAGGHTIFIGGVYTGVPIAPTSILTPSDPLDPTSVSSFTIELTALADANNNPVNLLLGTTFVYAPDGMIALPPGAALSSGWKYRLDITTGIFNLFGLQATASSITFITSLTAGSSQSVTSGGVVVDVPAGAIPDGASVLLQPDADLSPLLASPAAIQAALDKLPPTYGSASRAVRVVEVDVLDSLGNPVRVPSRPLHLTVPYADADADGFVDGSNPPIPVSHLAIWRMETPGNVWVRLPASRVDRGAKTVSADLTHFSVFAVLNVASSDLSLLKVFPNPFRPSRGHTGVTFSNLPTQATIKIFTLSGRSVRTLDASDGSGSFTWDGRNAAGTLVAPDVYLFLVESGDAKTTGKLAVGS